MVQSREVWKSRAGSENNDFLCCNWCEMMRNSDFTLEAFKSFKKRNNIWLALDVRSVLGRKGEGMIRDVEHRSESRQMGLERIETPSNCLGETLKTIWSSNIKDVDQGMCSQII